MSFRRLALPIVALVALFTAFACAAEDGGPATADIVSTIPWTAPESYRYVLENRDREKLGEAAFTVKREGDAFVLERTFADDEGNADESQVSVDAETLKPRSGIRQITDKDSRRVAEFTYEYEPDDTGIVQITQKTYDPPDSDEPDSTRSNPLRVPEHSYDTHSSLFIWRTIRFEEDYKVTYTEVFSNRREKAKITLEVQGQERVQTPAGEFDAWYVRITDGNDHQDAWFATTDDHKLLVYDNGQQIFLYEGPAE